MSKVKKIVLIAIFAFIAFWIASFIHCEYLTATYGHEFEDVHEELSQIVIPSKWKVLKFSESYAEVYFYSKEGGVVVSLNFENQKWTIDEWIATWSKTGSADDLIWPYIR